MSMRYMYLLMYQDSRSDGMRAETQSALLSCRGYIRRCHLKFAKT